MVSAGEGIRVELARPRAEFMRQRSAEDWRASFSISGLTPSTMAFRKFFRNILSTGAGMARCG
jgi:hypothetical protein